MYATVKALLLISKQSLFLFMLHCIDIYTVIKNFIGYVLGFLEFC